MPTWMKIAGIADGVVVAGLLALGQGYPPWAPWTTVAAQVLGGLGTIFGGVHAASKKDA